MKLYPDTEKELFFSDYKVVKSTGFYGYTSKPGQIDSLLACELLFSCFYFLVSFFCLFSAML